MQPDDKDKELISDELKRIAKKYDLEIFHIYTFKDDTAVLFEGNMCPVCANALLTATINQFSIEHKPGARHITVEKDTVH